MIFATVGEQLPFDRLIRAVDEWAATSGVEVFAQIGKTQFKPKNIDFQNFLSADKYKKQFQKADSIVSHAGMGTIIMALEMGKRILVMPRLAVQGECRNDHQVATTRRFLSMNYVTAAFHEMELETKLDQIISLPTDFTSRRCASPSNNLIRYIRGFVIKK